MAQQMEFESLEQLKDFYSSIIKNYDYFDKIILFVIIHCNESRQYKNVFIHSLLCKKKIQCFNMNEMAYFNRNISKCLKKKSQFFTSISKVKNAIQNSV